MPNRLSLLKASGRLPEKVMGKDPFRKVRAMGLNNRRLQELRRRRKKK